MTRSLRSQTLGWVTAMIKACLVGFLLLHNTDAQTISITPIPVLEILNELLTDIGIAQMGQSFGVSIFQVETPPGSVEHDTTLLNSFNGIDATSLCISVPAIPSDFVGDFGFLFSVSSADGQSRESYEITILDCSVTDQATTTSNQCDLPASSSITTSTSPGSTITNLPSSTISTSALVGPGPALPSSTISTSALYCSPTRSNEHNWSRQYKPPIGQYLVYIKRWQGSCPGSGGYGSVAPGHDKRKTIVAIVGGVASLFVVSFIVGFFILRRRRYKSEWKLIDPFPLNAQESGEGTRGNGTSKRLYRPESNRTVLVLNNPTSRSGEDDVMSRLFVEPPVSCNGTEGDHNNYSAPPSYRERGMVAKQRSVGSSIRVGFQESSNANSALQYGQGFHQGS
ncbi:hypothetical protein K435DRAFT_807466 [Dendrothele bispora CBS 962.96]|uniref:Mid2 domain-containing protein n=1 Tax=Dendrothele bispora (strain CBS 962.96) TaxID=1314807 RepID=A0A4S8L4I7_DENBC|nr:hypothetical protein K435DRAFT_807466 [Dendrothele bispora CBS 962.96]